MGPPNVRNTLRGAMAGPKSYESRTAQGVYKLRYTMRNKSV